MCQCRFEKAQIIGMVKEQEAGMPTAEVCLRRGLGSASFDKFKANYGGMNISETHHCKLPEDENAALKRLLAVTILDRVISKESLRKN
jgi:putative transposase